ncbi:unnamed protein product [Rotaria sp. Silwood1]|nr:unnamed protein product [Rotaria sp. Silwood1]CAF3515960.1 unnamed protein product [Rotaria sp. Silwood1]CAF4727348.1 unnamed protein product [Rotaria sp. Silwood1]CAF4863283.1 unnamed protein product [Rotaria sp. Silwood1]
MPNITSIIQCNDTLDSSNTCTEQPFINVSACQDYIRSTSVLCAITVNDITTTRRSLIYENYETYLSEKVYEAQSIINMGSSISLNETATNAYVGYTDAAARPVQECVCTNFLCNHNISICVSQTVLQVETTILTYPSTDISSAGLTTAAFVSVELSSMSNSIPTFTTTTISSTTTTSSTTISTTEVSSTTTTTISTTEVSFTTTTSTTEASSTSATTSSTLEASFASATTGFTMEASFTSATTISTTAASSTLATISTATISSTLATISTATISSTLATISTATISSTLATVIITTAASSASTIVTEAPTTTLSSKQPNVVTGETGLGQAAAAGIACGIIFSALIFTGEIIFFKVFHASGSDRAVRYQA